MIVVRNPAGYSFLSQQRSLLCEEAIACWQQFLLTFYKDPYLPNVHFAMGLLKAQQGLTTESLAAYKLLANRFLRSDLAPEALMHSAKLKLTLYDYPGAYGDFKEVVEQYPDYDGIVQAFLSLADAAARTGRGAEAARLFEKVYYLNDSAQTQSDGALAAGRLYYQNNDFTNAEKWLSRYIHLEQSRQDARFYPACLSLGKTWRALGNSQSARDALRASLAGRLCREDYIEALHALVEIYMEQECFIEALQALNDADSRQLSQEESIRLLLLKSRALRGMGLPEKAVVMLRDREEYLVDGRLKAQVGCELSDCYIEQGLYELAHKKLASILESTASGPTAHRAMYQLANVCHKLGLDVQAMNLCSQLLSVQPAGSLKRETLELLAAIYRRQKNYDRAALALLGQWDRK